jgi:hypothetical protein
VTRASLILAFLLVSCGRPPAGEAYLFTQKFDELAKAHGRYVATSSITIDIADLGGVGERIDCAAKHVTIDSGAWADTRDGYREALVFHVLAHCLVKRGHRNGVTTSGAAICEPWSLMNSGFVAGNLYSADRDRYQEELFSAPFINDTAYP